MDTAKWELDELEDGTGQIVIWDYDDEGEVDGCTVVVPSVYLDDDEARKAAHLLVTAPKLLAALEQVNDCLVKCLTGGEVSAKLAGKAIENAAIVIAQAKGEQP